MMDAPRRSMLPDLCPIDEILLLCTRASRDATDDEYLRSLLLSERLNWAALWEQATLQQVTPLVARTITTSRWANQLPPSAVSEATRARITRWSDNRLRDDELQRLAGLLHASGIPVAPLKGTHLARRLFDALDARATKDIDILVPESRLEEARSIIYAAGYAPVVGVSHGLEEHSFHGVPLVRQHEAGYFVVELHWKLSNPRFVSVDYPGLWQRILSTSPTEQPLRPLPSEETLLFLALHLPKHNTGMLRLVADIDRLVRREGPAMDWGYTLALAGRWQVQWLVYFALLRAHALLDTPLPADVLERLRPPTWRTALVQFLTGPETVLRPPLDPHLRGNRFQLSYCAMLSPFGRVLDAYRYYLMAPGKDRWRAPFSGVLTGLVGVVRGLYWTGVSFSSPLAERRFKRRLPGPGARLSAAPPPSPSGRPTSGSTQAATQDGLVTLPASVGTSQQRKN